MNYIVNGNRLQQVTALSLKSVLFAGLLLSLFHINIQQDTAGLRFLSEAQAHHFGGGGGPKPPKPDEPDPPQEPDPPTPPEKEQDSTPDTCEDNTTGEGKTPTSGGSVYLFSGYESFSYKDITVKGLYDIEIVRIYNSESAYDSTLGYGWSINYDRRLFEYPDQSVVIRYGCGHKDRFIYTGSAYQTPVGGMSGTLEAMPAGEFVFTHANSTKDFYDAQGRFIARENLEGHRLEFTYDIRGKLPLTGVSPYALDTQTPMVVAKHYRLTKIEERTADGVLTGNFIDLYYDEGTGRLKTATSNDGRQITYTHDVVLVDKTLGNLVTVNGLENHVSTYIYDDRDINGDIQDIHNITSIQEGNLSTPYINTYDIDDRVITQSHGDSLKTFDYVVPNSNTKVTTTVKDDLGTILYSYVDEYFFDPLTEEVIVYIDGMGNRFEYDYDALNFPLQTRIFHNQGTVISPILALQKTIDYIYDPDGNKLEEKVTLDDIGSGAEVITRSWTYNDGWIESKQVVSSFAPTKVFRTEYKFNRKDEIGPPESIKERWRLKDDGSYEKTTYLYDSKIRLTRETLADGHRKHYRYDGVGHPYLTKIYHEIGTTGVESPFDSETFDYDPDGNVSDIWDANNNHTQFSYNNQEKITNIINALDEETIYTYVDDRLEQIEIGKTVAEGEGQIIKLNYDSFNRLENIQRKNDIGTFITKVTYTYDSEGRKLSEKDGVNNVTKYEYDLAGRLSKTIDPLLKETSYSYDALGQLISVVDANLNETRYTFDDVGRRIKVEQLGVMPNVVTQLSYDANDNLLGVIDGESHTTSYVYDSLSQKTSEQKDMGQLIQYFYDDRNRLDYLVNARGQKIDYDYYEWGAAQTIEYFSDTVTAIVDRTIGLQYYNTGTLKDVTDTSISTGQLYSYTYDKLNRQNVTNILAFPGTTNTHDLDYDRYGNRSKLTLTDDSGTYIHQYNYDKLNQLASANLPGTQDYNNILYFDDNNLKQITAPSSLATDYLYEANGPVKDIKLTDGATIIEQLTYNYDNVLNVDTITDVAGLHDYGYDGLYRLTSAIHPSGLNIATAENYQYDKAGNREDPADLLLYDYDNNNRITASPGVTSYGHDFDGNMLNKDAAIFTYNHDNRIVTFDNGTDTASYGYDPMGRRINKTVNGITTWYLWEGANLLAEYDNGGVQQKRYAYLPYQFTPIQMAVGANIYDIHSDHLSTPRLLTDASKNIVWRAHYASFGEVGLAVESVEFNMRFPGQYYDSESGLHYNYFRDYDPSIGRYVESDPIGLAGGFNVYGYSMYNPVNKIDYYGLFESLLWQQVNVEKKLLDAAADQGAKCLVPCAVETVLGAAGEKGGMMCLDITRQGLENAKHVDEAWKKERAAFLKKKGIELINDAKNVSKKVSPVVTGISAAMCWVQCVDGN